MKDTARWIALGALFLIPFLPLYVESSLFFPFITGKGFAFRILVGIAAGAWVLLAVLDKKYRPQWSWTFLIYGALLAWMFIADLFGVNPHKAFWSNYERMDGFVTLAHTFVFFLVTGAFLTAEKKWRAWWLTALAASALVVFHGLMQLLCAGNACANTFEIHQGGVRVDANVGNAAYLAVYLLFMIAVALWQAFISKGWLRYILFVLAGLQFIVLYATATRGALLGFMGAVVLSLALYALLSGGKARKVACVVLVGVVVFIGGFLALKDTAIVQNDPTLYRIASISLSEGATRFTLWNMALQGVAERPFFGWGHEGYNYIFNEHYQPSLFAQETWFDRAHSVYMDWMVSGGIPAFLLFVALLVVGAVTLLRSSLPRVERVLLVGAIAAYAFQALFVFDNLLSYIMLAGVLALAHSASQKPIRQFERLPEAGKGIAPTAAAVVLALTIVVVWVVNVPSIQGGQALIKGIRANPDLAENLTAFEKALGSNTFALQEVREQLMSFASQVAGLEQIPVDVRATLLARAVSEMQIQIASARDDARLRLMLAQGYEAQGNLHQALAEVENALALSPKKQAIMIQRGIELWKLGQRSEAYDSFAEAYALDESFGEVAVSVAVGHIINGRYQEANTLLQKHFGTTTVDRPTLRFAYFEAKQFESLIALVRAGVGMAGGSLQSRFELVQALALAGRANEARAELDLITRLYPNATAQVAQVRAGLNL